MTADPETIAALAEIKTLLGVQGERAEEDRRAGAGARDKIDKINTNLQVTRETLTEHVEQTRTKFDRVDESLKSAHGKIDRVRMGKAEIGGAAASGGVIMVALQKLWAALHGGAP